ncbi:nudix hydrolase 22 [Capsaspora owczarzaki ATCC 30864]|uniref:Nudix hydrolase 22 n=1 Tax=Capsaspora owczarzaki (strain ATCC 30864) TaxID=595528 RepID=A0A0D2X2N6_CAPO3|nr:nudix hydrolase 22 [Capsaspora owczarzaki ATCC 30864]KJE92874.1 nudix hydrolase 22 [Capsaspora owczarzaki ATCC 30864]|eukprot:XP_004363492.1 nudix hydrolase 22 [Capsaspora owczarzaki ATCC 30864]
MQAPDVDVILERLRHYIPEHPQESLSSSLRALPTAAVLVGLFYCETTHSVRVLLTKRAVDMRSHGGEVAFPGGKRDDTDRDAAHTALREAEEEVGLPQTWPQVIKAMAPFVSKNLLLVTPVVAWLGNRSQLPRLTPNPREVSVIFDAPFDMFALGLHHSFMDISFRSVPFRIHFFDYPIDALSLLATSDKVDPTLTSSANIFGLTALVLIVASKVAYEHTPSFSLMPPGGLLPTQLELDGDRFVLPATHQPSSRL